MKQATRMTVVAVAQSFVSICVVMTDTIAAVWLTEEVRARAKLLNQIRVECNERRQAA